jgi:ABC-2 type transport system permease protein
MTLTPTRYVLPRRELRPRSWRIWTLFAENMGLMARTGPLILATMGFLICFLPLLIEIVFAEVFQVSAQLTVQEFYFPFGPQGTLFSGFGTILFFLLLLMATIVGSGIIADDLKTRAIALYLSRPINVLDYLTAKSCVVGAWLALICMLPGLLTVLLATVLGYASGAVAVQAFGAYLGVGLLLTGCLSGISLLFSSLTERRAFAAVMIFATLLFDELLAAILEGVTGDSSWLYVSPWEDVRSVAAAAFSYPPAGSPPASPLDPTVALAVLLAFIVALFALVYLRLSKMQVVSD